jgi:ubiquinone/menaquinone biosynthesis C-methylase UbiE
MARSLYDFLAPAYDPLLKPIYAPYRKRALQCLEVGPGASVLDLACGTGQNFPYLESQIGVNGRIVGVDISIGMLRKAKAFVARKSSARISLIQSDAANLSRLVLQDWAGLSEVDAVVCSFGLTAMQGWEAAFLRSFHILKPGGTYLIHDIHAVKPTLHARGVEFVTRVDLSRNTWRPLENLSRDFHVEYFDRSDLIFGGRLFVASGTKPH